MGKSYCFACESIVPIGKTIAESFTCSFRSDKARILSRMEGQPETFFLTQPSFISQQSRFSPLLLQFNCTSLRLYRRGFKARLELAVGFIDLASWNISYFFLSHLKTNSNIPCYQLLCIYLKSRSVLETLSIKYRSIFYRKTTFQLNEQELARLVAHFDNEKVA